MAVEARVPRADVTGSVARHMARRDRVFSVEGKSLSGL